MVASAYFWNDEFIDMISFSQENRWVGMICLEIKCQTGYVLRSLIYKFGWKKLNKTNVLCDFKEPSKKCCLFGKQYLISHFYLKHFLKNESWGSNYVFPFERLNHQFWYRVCIGDFPYQYANALSTWEIECTSSSGRSWYSAMYTVKSVWFWSFIISHFQGSIKRLSYMYFTAGICLPLIFSNLLKVIPHLSC